MNEFDIKALTWDDNPQFAERSKHIADKIREHVPLTKKMVGFEYGCGTGLISFNLMPYLKSITLADSSDGMLDVLRKKIQKHNVATMEILKTDLIIDKIPDKKFDIIYTALTLHHIEDIKTILARFYKMLNNSAFLSVADLDKEDGSFHGPEFHGHQQGCPMAENEKVRYDNQILIKILINNVIIELLPVYSDYNLAQ